MGSSPAPHQGLTREQVEASRLAHGTNAVQPKTLPPSWIHFAIRSLNDRCLLILMAATAVSAGVAIYGIASRRSSWHDLWEPIGIAVAVVVVVATNATNDFRRDRKFRQLQDVVNDASLQVSVYRQPSNDDFEWKTMHMHDVVVGDLASVRTGDLVPADGVVLEATDLSVDESQQTGESESVNKAANETVKAASKVVAGTALLRVTAVGEASSNGQILRDIYGSGDVEDERTLLQQKLDLLADRIALVGAIGASVLFVIIVLKGILVAKQPVIDVILHGMIQTVTLLVVIVPEGLPMAVTLTLVYGSTMLMQRGCLVRHLAACETMASVTTICTDKTGTLTQNRMTIVEKDVAEEEESLLRRAIKANVDASKAMTATEQAMHTMLSESEPDDRILMKIPFSSKAKFSAAIVEDTLKGGKPVLRALIIGAADQLTARVQTNKGIDGLLHKWSRQALRCLAVATTTGVTAAVLDELDQAPLEDKLVLLLDKEASIIALLGLQDPLRANSRSAIETCQRAGISVRMLTGDSVETAKAIATAAGILMPGGLALEGSAVTNLLHEHQTHNNSLAFLKRLQVVARSRPSDKLTLVKQLQALGHVVAVTGDGTNDAPSLRQADLGFVMGQTGTQVAKCAADIVFVEDDFGAIVPCLKIARQIRQGIRRFLTFQLTVNAVAVVVAFTTALAGMGSALRPLQMLWINLAMDSVAALSMALPSNGGAQRDGDEDELMRSPPEHPESPLLNYSIWRDIASQTVLQSTILLSTYFAWPASQDKETVTFHAFVCLQMGNQLAVMRKTPTRLFAGVWLACMLAQLGIMMGIPQVFLCTRLPVWQVFALMGVILAPIILSLLVSLLPERGRKPVPEGGEEAQLSTFSREQLKWHHTIGRIRHRLSVYRAIRR